ncbi:MAG: hypothetical protein HY000_32265 [Planctomycetes bacterium]|nr:hypothetical protein [Planctomycetota bacterium]
MEVLIARRASSNALSLEGLSQVYSGGAHGILATSSGSMLAPLGDDGLLIITVDGDELVVGETRHPVVPLNLYRIVSVADGGAEQIYACAARRDGVVVFKFAGNRLTAPPQVHQLGGEDIVDVTSIAIPEHPRATVCLGRDRRLFFFRDVLDAREPAVLTYDGFQGVAYCLLATQGHVFMLTDQEFIRFPHLATRFLRDDQFSEPMDAWVLETDASDAYLAGNEQVLLLRGDGAISYRVNDLVQHFSEPALTNGQTIVGLTWMDRRTPSFTHAEWSLQTNLTMPLGGA